MNIKNLRYFRILPVFAVMIAIGVYSCTQPTIAPDEEYVMERISSRSYPEFTDDMMYDGLEHSLSKSLEYLQKLPIDRKFSFGEDFYTTEHMIQSIRDFLVFIQNRPDVDDLNEFIH